MTWITWPVTCPAVRAVRSPGGRTLRVELTDAGHGLIEGSVERLLRHEDDLIGHLSPAERDQLTELLRKLLDGLIEGGTAGLPEGAAGE
ncbi:hypothetical protein NE236_23065 [Actinoallomurus purpureus]|uniref:hypothetical protein n=1 Tax=Actinoallomurus purpureus TaxID=478114 RepID=UPI002092B909|nr:hypothetical protein [Actinoallomurus purpureus]MCO6007864.1 hypothetical protein [Actinoallomurus purpureus]